MTLASKILEEPLKRDRPLWHITFVDGFRLNDDDPDSQGFALIVRLHHAAIDAFSGEDILSNLLEYTPEPRQSMLHAPGNRALHHRKSASCSRPAPTS